VARPEHPVARDAIRRSKIEADFSGIYRYQMCSHTFLNSTNTIIYMSTFPNIYSHHILVIDVRAYRVCAQCTVQSVPLRYQAVHLSPAIPVQGEAFRRRRIRIQERFRVDSWPPKQVFF
jgi:hypothetical protein